MSDNATRREQILGRIRTSLNVDADAMDRLETVADRLEDHKRNIVPERATGTVAQNVKQFCERMEAVNGTVEQVRTPSEIPGAIANYLRLHNLPQKVRRGSDPALDKLPWGKARSLEVAVGAARKTDEVSVSRAFAAVAESGTLVMTSGSDNPTSLNFLPENHIVVVESGRIAGSYEDAWDVVRAVYGDGEMPRTVNLISGPSRTGDIEQKIELGAHGPRRLHVIVLNRPGASK
ncbi:MAG: lactate utilization protein [Pseudomonadota bacterium]